MRYDQIKELVTSATAPRSHIPVLAPSRNGNVMRFEEREGFAICRVSLREQAVYSSFSRLISRPRRANYKTLAQSLIHWTYEAKGESGGLSI